MIDKAGNSGAKETTVAILADLEAQSDDMIWAKELQFSGGRRRADFWTLHPHASKNFTCTCYEVKVSRSDFKRETHDKQREARLYSDHFNFVAPVGLIKPDEIPDWAGLLEWTPEEKREQYQRAFKVCVASPALPKAPPSWELVVSVLRYATDSGRDEALNKKIIAGLRWEVSRLKKRLSP